MSQVEDLHCDGGRDVFGRKEASRTKLAINRSGSTTDANIKKYTETRPGHEVRKAIFSSLSKKYGAGHPFWAETLTSLINANPNPNPEASRNVGAQATDTKRRRFFL